MIKTFLKFVFSISLIVLASFGQLHKHTHSDITSVYSLNGIKLFSLNDAPHAYIQSSVPSKERNFELEAVENEVEEDVLESDKKYWLTSKYLASLFYLHLPWCFSHPYSQSLAFSEHFPCSLSFRSLYHKFEVFRI